MPRYLSIFFVILGLNSLANAQPLTPERVAVITNGGAVTLEWSPSTGAQEYRIYRGNSPSNLGLLSTTGSGQTSYSDTGLDNGSLYYYAVSAVGAGAVESPLSPVRGAVPVIKQGHAIEFGGTGRAEAPHNTLLNFQKNTPFTIEVWVFTNQVTGTRNLISKNTGSATSTGWSLVLLQNNDLQFNITASDGTRFTAVSQNFVPFQRWTHVAVTYDGSGSAQGIQFYENGQGRSRTITQSAGGGDASTTEPLRFSSSAGFVWGRMDDIRIWNVQRTGSQLESHFNQPLRGDENGLLGYWRMDETSGLTIWDATGNYNDATRIGSTAQVLSGSMRPNTTPNQSAVGGTNQALIQWSPAEERGFKEYVILRHDGPTNSPNYGTNTIATITDRLQTSYTDHTAKGGNVYYYFVATRDVNNTASPNVNQGLPANVYKTHPGGHPLHVEAVTTASQPDRFRLNWTDHSVDEIPDGYLVLVHSSEAGAVPPPANGTELPNDADLSDGNGALNILQGVQTAVFTGALPHVTYNATIYPYTNSGAQRLYLTGGAQQASARTYLRQPEIFVAESRFEEAHLTWTPVNHAQEYQLFRALNNGGSTLYQTFSSSVTEFTDEDLSNGTLYRYRLKSLGPDGNESAQSVEKAAVPVIKQGRMARFNNVAGTVTRNAMAWPGGNFSVEFWYKPLTDQAGAYRPIFRGANAAGTSADGLYQVGDKLVFKTQSTFGPVLYTTNTSFKVNHWHHVVVNINNTNFLVDIVIDGVANPLLMGSEFRPANLVIGGTASGNAMFEMDEFRIWSIMLGGADLQNRRNRIATPGDQHLHLLYSFNEPAGTGTVFDGANRGQHATVASSVSIVASTAYPPPPVTGLTATPMIGQVALFWSKPSETANLTTYSLFRGATQIATIENLNTIQYFDTGASSTALNNYTIRVNDIFGAASNPSASVSAQAFKNRPSNHVSGINTIADFTTLTLRWTDVSSGVIPDGYLVHVNQQGFAPFDPPQDGNQYGNVNPPGSGRGRLNVNPGVRQAQFVELQNSTTYEFRVYPYVNTGSNRLYFSEGVALTAALTLTPDPGIFQARTGEEYPFMALKNGTTTWIDYNMDGLPDLLLTGGAFVDGVLRPFTKLYRNTGGGFEEETDPSWSLPAVMFSSVDVADVNRNGRPDIVIAGNTNLTTQPQTITEIYFNTPEGFIKAEGDGYIFPGIERGIVTFSPSFPNGNRDLLVSGSSNGVPLTRYFTYGRDGFTQETSAGFTVLPNLRNSGAAWVDFNLNGNYDLILCGLNESNQVFTRFYNRLGAGFMAVTSTGFQFPAVQMCQIATADVNGDGRLDVLITGSPNADGSGAITRLYETSGNNTTPWIERTGTNYPFVNLRNATGAFADFNNNGRTDILLVGQQSNGAGFAKLYENTGTAFVSRDQDVYQLPALRSASLSWTDYNNNGKPDFILIGEQNNLQPAVYLMQNEGNFPSNQAPSVPSGLTVELSLQTGLRFSWQPPSDDHTPSNRLGYQVQIDDEFGNTIISPIGRSGTRTFFTLGGYRSNISYTWKVQAIDANGKASAFSAPQTWRLDAPGTLGTPESTSGWRLIAAPFDGTLGDLLANVWTQGFPGAKAPSDQFASNVFLWQESGERGWKVPTSMSQVVLSGIGVAVFIYEDDDPVTEGIQGGFPKALAMKGSPRFFNSSRNLSFTETGGGQDGFHLVGNPFEIPIDWDAASGIAKTNLEPYFYVWDADHDRYAIYSSDGASVNGGVRQIAPYQGFWVRATAPANLNIGRAAVAETSPGLRKESENKPVYLTFQINSGSRFEQTQLIFTDDPKSGIPQIPPMSDTYLLIHSLIEEAEIDVLYLENNRTSPESVKLEIRSTVSGLHTLTWSELPDLDGIVIILEDLHTGETYKLTETAEISILVTSGDPYRMRVHFDGSSGTTAEDTLADLPVKTALHQNTPNPFNPSTIIRFDLVEAGAVRLVIYDILGREVATLVNEIMPAGFHTTRFDASNISSGVYLYRLELGNRIITRKMAVVK